MVDVFVWFQAPSSLFEGTGGSCGFVQCLSQKLGVSSLACGDVCLHHGSVTNKIGRAHNFWISLPNKSNFFDAKVRK